MSHTLRPLSWLLPCAIAGAAILAVAAPASAGDKACTTTKFEFDVVKKACDDGGQKAAKQLMKDMVKKAKADGKDYKCTTCHTSIKTYELKPDAVDKLRPYI